jgi:hypothetical protein
MEGVGERVLVALKWILLLEFLPGRWRHTVHRALIDTQEHTNCSLCIILFVNQRKAWLSLVTVGELKIKGVVSL